MKKVQQLLEFLSVTIRAIRYGDWQCGWETRKKWPTKTYFGLGCIWHDGYWWYLHVGPFYLTAIV